MSKILVIEQKIDHLISTKALLKAILVDAEIITSTSGREGLLKAEQENPDVVVMNISIPGITCPNVCNLLKKNKQTTNIPILIITEPETTSEEKITALDKGADALINKPLKIPELSAQIKALLRIRNLELGLINDNTNLSQTLKTTTKKYSEFQILSENIYNNLSMGLIILVDDNITFINDYLRSLLELEKPVESLNINNLVEKWPTIKASLKNLNETSSSQTFETSIIGDCGKRHSVLLTGGRIEDSEENNKYFLNIVDISEISSAKKLQDAILKIHNYTNEIDDDNIFLSKVHELIKNLVPAKQLYIGLYDNLENIIKIPYKYSENQESYELPNPNSLASKVIKNKVTLNLSEREIANLRQKGETKAMEYSAKSWLGIPLLNNRKLIGLISIYDNKNTNTIEEGDVEKIELLSGSIAAALESRIQNKQLEIALAKAQKSDKLKNGFLSNISHEIRTPLNAIIGFSSMLYDEVEPWEKKEYLDLIIHNGDTLLRVIDDIVDMAKIESGEIFINQVETNVVELINKLYQKYLTNLEVVAKKLKLKIEIPDRDKLILIKTDPFRLTQILENIITNSIKFTQSGSITIGLSYINKETLNFYIHDTGIGIPKEKINTIFDRFTQVEEGHIREFGGNGIGLTITKNLVNLLNGEIFVESEVGKGSKFRISLPINEPKFLPNGAILKNKATYNWSSKKVLLVDDVVSNLEYLDLLLKKTKAKTIWAQNGKKALEIYKKDTDIDIIIMDLQMPVMDGYQATRLIKEINPHVPIIIQTAFIELSNEKLAKEAGCDYYLQKPIKPNQLLEALDKYI